MIVGGLGLGGGQCGRRRAGGRRKARLDRAPMLYEACFYRLPRSFTEHITGEQHESIRKHGFSPYAGTDASSQPADMPDVFPHKTAVAWCRSCLKKHPLERGSLDAMENELQKKLADAARCTNRTYDVHGLRSSFPELLDKLRKRGGDRLTEH